mmetsp:Transcript_20989/g.67623  ORF Transcript_20989/g.67623 Transcript_20989/m.67623 type:complete len:338 (-) Transcript_20989:105-1118(-)|eukprot:CAMPEP_0118903792 /NCGR_PEP_ID=MMETSP1166-20130328/8516_1 /TAXON_ID=1104430 /ORGANISM="Chrysoreinhardia sp, Strain CCMP3193" /LENGTH=337 /DNA_ID=CAMNT_0006843029 /DNA_START=99 /DNA_END=1112 /DNA_ORIENTATION=+
MRWVCWVVLPTATSWVVFPPAAQRGRSPRRRQGLLPTAASPLEIDGSVIYESLSEFGVHAGQDVVVKYGGHAMSDDTAALHFAQDVVLMQRLGIRPVVVHGGGPQIGEMLERLEVPTRFVEGLRVTDEETVAVAEMVLCGSINKKIAAAVTRAGGHALGLSGRDDSLIVAEKLIKHDPKTDETIDLGLVGDPVSVNAKLLADLLDQRIVPVVAPIASGADGEKVYSVNADTAAGAVAEAVQASRLLLLTDVVGVLDADGQLIKDITPQSARKLIADGVIKGGMIPKLQTAVHAVNHGVKGAAIVDGREDHAILKELFSKHGAGTLVTPGTPSLLHVR